MKNTKMKQSIAALAMAAVVAVSLLGYGCGSKPASTTGAGATGDFTGTAKGFGGDVTVTLTLTDGKITGCTAEGADET
jgi:fumarate reductase flavoprotein subunit